MDFDFCAFLTDTNRVQTDKDLVATLEKYLAQLGVETFLISTLTEFPAYGLPAHLAIIQSYPEDWMNHYIQRSYNRIDPVRLQCMQSGAFHWEELMKQPNHSRIQRTMMLEAAEAGLASGFAVGVDVSHGQKAGIGFASCSKLEADADHLSLYNHLGIQFANRFLEINRKRPSQNHRALSIRQAETLEWIASGLTLSEVSDRMKCSERTVKHHLQEACLVLGANSREQAIVMALNRGQIYTVPTIRKKK